jgi:hypothetical protein
VSVWQSLREHSLYDALFAATARHLSVGLSAVASAFFLADPAELRALLGTAGFERIEITPCSLDVHLKAPRSASSSSRCSGPRRRSRPSALHAPARSRLVAAVVQETASLVQQYRDGDRLTFPMVTNIGKAYA